MEQRTQLAALLQTTEAIYARAQAIHGKMEDNDAEQVVALQALFDEREETILQLQKAAEGAGFQWSEEDQQRIVMLKNLEERLQPLINRLHASFLLQIDRLGRTKQVSKKYIGAYQNQSAEGSFIDKRK